MLDVANQLKENDSEVYLQANLYDGIPLADESADLIISNF
jgi:hypothetical protein